MAGSETALMQSWSATLEWVRPPGLTMMPRALLRCSWMKSMSCALVVRLERGDVHVPPGAGLPHHLLDLAEGRVPVDLRLALAEQVQVGAVDEEDHVEALPRPSRRVRARAYARCARESNAEISATAVATAPAGATTSHSTVQAAPCARGSTQRSPAAVRFLSCTMSAAARRAVAAGRGRGAPRRRSRPRPRRPRAGRSGPWRRRGGRRRRAPPRRPPRGCSVSNRPAASTPWPKVWPRLRSLRSPCSVGIARDDLDLRPRAVRDEGRVGQRARRRARTRPRSAGRSAAYFTTSPRPERSSRRGQGGEGAPGRRAPPTGGWKAPTAFFATGRFTAVLPPIAASTIARRVVGTATQGTPRMNVAARKPAASRHRAAAHRHDEAAARAPAAQELHRRPLELGEGLPALAVGEQDQGRDLRLAPEERHRPAGDRAPEHRARRHDGDASRDRDTSRRRASAAPAPTRTS